MGRWGAPPPPGSAPQRTLGGEAAGPREGLRDKLGEDNIHRTFVHAGATPPPSVLGRPPGQHHLCPVGRRGLLGVTRQFLGGCSYVCAADQVQGPLRERVRVGEIGAWAWCLPPGSSPPHCPGHHAQRQRPQTSQEWETARWSQRATQACSSLGSWDRSLTSCSCFY